LTVSRVVLLQELRLLAVLIVGAVLLHMWYQGYYYYATDDAVVAATMANAAPGVSGTIVSIKHQAGDEVNKGETLATLTTATDATTIVSPLTGTIYNIVVTSGEYVHAGETVAQVVDLSSVYIRAYVSEDKITDVHNGQRVDVTVAGASMHGIVQLIQPATASTTSPLPTTDYGSGNFTAVTQRVPVHIWIDGTNGHIIYPGESATVNIHLHDNN
jgi:multidrug resistance efflux pump